MNKHTHAHISNIIKFIYTNAVNKPSVWQTSDIQKLPHATLCAFYSYIKAITKSALDSRQKEKYLSKKVTILYYLSKFERDL